MLSTVIVHLIKRVIRIMNQEKRSTTCYIPGIEQLGSSEKVKIAPIQVTSLLPSLAASGLEQVTSTTVPWFTGNCVVVSIVLVHSVFNPVQSGAVSM